EALPAALGVVEEVGAVTLLSLVRSIDRDEAFEILAARFARDPFFGELLGRYRLAHGDDRWIAQALTRLHEDAGGACRLLASVGTERSREELAGLVENAALDDAVFVEAMRALHRSAPVAD